MARDARIGQINTSQFQIASADLSGARFLDLASREPSGFPLPVVQNGLCPAGIACL